MVLKSRKSWGKYSLSSMLGVIYNSLIHLENQQISSFMFKKMNKYAQSLHFQLNLTKSFQKFISHTTQRREKVEDCIVFFLGFHF